MAVLPDFAIAASISLAGCNACRCGNLFVRLHDANGDIFAIASMPLATAKVFAAQLGEHITEATGGSLSLIRCEGTA